MAAETSYYFFDGLGSTVALTDSTENVTDTYVYNSSGEQVGGSSPSVNPFRFVGQKGYYYDPDVADYYVRRRQYRPLLLRWLSEDAIDLQGGDLNLYRYVENNPVIKVDPSGKQAETGKQETCTFQICSSPLPGVLGLGATHLFILCGGVRYRGQPGRNPDDPAGEGIGMPDCKCRTQGRGQLIGSFDNWDQKPIDHPENPDRPYNPKDLHCVDVTSNGSCDDVCACIKNTLRSIQECCIAYNPTPNPLKGGDGNSNSAAVWMLKQCQKPPRPVLLPGLPKIPTGIADPVPQCVQDKAKR